MDLFTNSRTMFPAIWFSLLMFLKTWKSTQAGSCWINVEDSGRCAGLHEIGITKDECCSSGIVSAGWTPHDQYEQGRLFYFEFLAGGAPECYPCHRMTNTDDSLYESCDNVQCAGEDRKCRLKDGRARCVCAPDCSHHDERLRGHVCGSDGNTYRNYCTMLKTNCRKGRHVQVEYHGRCKYSCERVHCLNGKNCVEDQNGMPHCIPCETECPAPRPGTKPICGADGITYPSFCHFRIATCLNVRSIGVAYMGTCDTSMTCSTLTCDWGKKCLTNPKTNRPQCVTCDGSCSQMSSSVNPVCGTDGESYSSWCSMQKTACERGVVIETKHYGPCHADGLYEEIPLNDEYDLEYYQDLFHEV